jgi:hypothetical protein
VVLCLAGFSQAAAQDSFIVGDCFCDSAANKTICEYTVFSGYPALSHLIFPIPVNCVEQFTVSSPYFTFDPAQTFVDPINGDVYGIRTIEEPPEGQTERIIITYDGICTLGTDFVRAATKTDPTWNLFPVPAVIDCPPIPFIEVSLESTEFLFQIKRPGVYAARLFTMSVRSNMAVTVRFRSFDDLAPVEGTGGGSIPTSYAAAPVTQDEPPDEFMNPGDFNAYSMHVRQDVVHSGFSLWARLVVTNATSAYEYGDNAIIQLVLENSIPSVDDDY